MNKDYRKLYKKWKAIGIILLVIMSLMFLSFIILGISERIEDNKTKVCFYEICANYPDAEYYDDICTCYDYDALGQLIVAKEEYMK